MISSNYIELSIITGVAFLIGMFVHSVASYKPTRKSADEKFADRLKDLAKVKVRIGQEWTMIHKEDDKWSAPICDETTAVIKITNISKNGKEVMYHFKTINGKPVAVPFSQYDNSVDWLERTYRLSKGVMLNITFGPNMGE
jgi:hypothetical protein